MRANEFLIELRDRLSQWTKQQFPTWPDYVVFDWIYKQAKYIQDHEQLEDWIQGIKKDYPVKQWRLETLDITLNIFTPKTQGLIKKRKGGTVNPFGIPKDPERHDTQATMIKQQGVSKEPIIVFKTPQGYDLLEGWHRTTQALKAFPQGYQGPAWVGYL